jgi:FkbM family methyltransferase
METIRRLVRQRIGYSSPLYRMAARTLTGSMTLWREGLGTYLQTSRLRATPSNGSVLVEVRFRSLEHPLYLRPGTDDLNAALNNIVRHEYGYQLPATPPRVMVDAGAYIGDTAVFFLNRFPGVTVYALEPNPKSRAVAERNLAPYGDRVTLIPAALSTTVGTVTFGGSEMGARIGEGGDLEVTTTTLPALLSQIPGGHIDILKMDIEGAEMGILSADVSGWLPHVGLLIVETHGPEITARLQEVMAAEGWQAVRYRNLFYCSPAA